MNPIEKAGSFLMANGRDIDKARYEYHFGSSNVEALLRVLSGYQNADGGFTRLELDIGAPQSNPFGVEIALLISLWAGVDNQTSLLQKTITFLEQSQDVDGGWRFVPEIYQDRLAPWFQGWNWPNLNPACTLAGLLLQLNSGTPEMQKRVSDLFDKLEKSTEVTDGDFYSVRPYAMYFIPETGHPRQEYYRSELINWFIQQHHQNKMDNTHFFEYIRSPTTYAGQGIPRDILDLRLDLLLHEQEEDGGWPSPYDPHWRPWITVNNLLILRAFGKI